ncbi:protein dopey-1 homolog [Macrobrachium nipponense]|uniref:protein dopey-1 homolog n=1 Tax=Macrobrachium nipponense TaxID=159736 RepID=UPI0030C86313
MLCTILKEVREVNVIVRKKEEMHILKKEKRKRHLFLQSLPLEVSVLQVFYVYVQQCPSSQLGECWGPLLVMVKEGTLTLSPPAQLVLLATLNEFVQRAAPLQEKKDIKELQEVSGKLLESCSNIAGSCLEATTWLRRNLTVKTESADKKDGVNDAVSYSVAALSVLAELLAPLLDVLYVSEEKDKVVPLLTNIMAHVVPYLRNHKRGNMAAFSACSQLLSSLSGYQYTVRAWRRDVLDLLLDPQAFMMLPPILPYWRTIVDYLCTHDKTVFKELLSRVYVPGWIIKACFPAKNQKRLAEVTRLGQVVPSLVAQVLLCFRVLLLRMSPRGVTSLWPVIITELVQVFLMMEQELATDSEQFRDTNRLGHKLKLCLEHSPLPPVTSNFALGAYSAGKNLCKEQNKEEESVPLTPSLIILSILMIHELSSEAMGYPSVTDFRLLMTFAEKLTSEIMYARYWI